MQLRRIAYWFIGLLGLLINLVHVALSEGPTLSGFIRHLSEHPPFLIGALLAIIPMFAAVGYLLLRYDSLLTAHRRAERTLRQSESKYRTLLENLPQNIFQKDINSVYVACNESFARELGITPDGFAGKTDYDFFPKELAEKYRADDKRIMESGETEELEETYIRDGQKVFVHTVKTAIKDENSNVVGILGIFWDITDRKRTEEMLRERIKELNCLFQIGHIVESSPKSSLEEILERIVNVLPHTWQYPEIACARISLDGREYITPNWQQTQWCQSADIHVDGEVCGTVQIYYLEERPELDEGPFLKEERKLIDAVAERLGRVIERRQAEETLRKSEERFRTVFEGATDGILAVNVETKRLVVANDRICEITGYSSEELLELSMADIHPKEDLPYVFDQFAQQTRSGPSLAKNIPVLTKDKEVVFCDVNSRPLRIDDQELLVGFFRDVTEQKLAEEALAESEGKYRTLAEASTERILIIGIPDGELKYANPTFAQSIGYQDSEQLLGRNPLDFIAPEDREQMEQGLRELARGGADKFVQTVRTLTKDGEARWHDIRAVRIDYQGQPAILGTGHDVTETRRLWEELNQQLLRDALTEVYNRRYFNETIIQEIKRADRYRHHTAFIMGDIDGLKAINDNYGHLMGDRILQGVAQVLESTVREVDMVIRYGGDEFLVVMPETPEEQAQQAVSRIEQNLADWLTEQVEIGVLQPDVPAQVGFSMGVASYEPGEEVAIEEILARADEAMYQTKQVKRQAQTAS